MIAFNDVIADILDEKELEPIITEKFIRGRKFSVDTSVVFITQSRFAFPKYARLNLTQYFIMKISDKRELQQIAFNHSSGIGFDYIVKIIKNAPRNLIPVLPMMLLFHQIIF